MGCAWRQIARIDRKIPSLWKLANWSGVGQFEFKGSGSSPRGFAVSRFHRCVMPGGTNLVIFPANLVEG
jgi:hypothetical protein